jgi:hypothetical protein
VLVPIHARPLGARSVAALCRSRARRARVFLLLLAQREAGGDCERLDGGALVGRLEIDERLAAGG